MIPGGIPPVKIPENNTCNPASRCDNNATMSKQTTTEILISRDHNGQEYADIPCEVTGDFYQPNRSDVAEVSIRTAVVTQAIKAESGEVIFPVGFPVCLTDAEEDRAAQQIIQEEE
jgi:hypothetical protein